MRISIKQPRIIWPWALGKFLFLGLVGRVPLNVFAALWLFAVYRTSEQYSTLDPLEFQQWKAPAEYNFTWTLWLLWWYYLFLNMLVYILTSIVSTHFSPDGNYDAKSCFRFEVSFHSEQDQTFERSNTEHSRGDGPISKSTRHLAYAPHSEQDQSFERKATEHGERDRPTSNSGARLTQPPGLDFEDIEEEPEPIIEHSRHSPSSSTPLPIDETHQRRQILHRAMPSSLRPDQERQRNEASQRQSHSHLTNSVQRHDIPSDRLLQPANNLPNPEEERQRHEAFLGQIHSYLTNSVQRHDLPSTSLSVQAISLPKPSYQATVEEEAPSDDEETASMYTAEGGDKAVIAYTAEIAKEKASYSYTPVPIRMAAEDGEKKAALAPTAESGKEKASSSHMHVPVRLTFKNRLLEEAIQDWKGNKSLNDLKELVYYDDDNDFDYIPNSYALMSERKRYEHYCFDATVRRSRPFHVYGSEDLHEHNRLRLWVNMSMHQDPRTLFPPGYKPITDEGDKISETGTLYSQTKSIFGSSISGTE